MTAKTQLLGDDLLVCVLGGVYTDVEKTMIELQRTTLVQETRSEFQQTMQHKFIAEVQRLSGRDVVAFIPTATSAPTSRSRSSCSHRRSRCRRSPRGANIGL